MDWLNLVPLPCADVPYDLTPKFLEELLTKHRANSHELSQVHNPYTRALLVKSLQPMRIYLLW